MNALYLLAGLHPAWLATWALCELSSLACLWAALGHTVFVFSAGRVPNIMEKSPEQLVLSQMAVPTFLILTLMFCHVSDQCGRRI